MFRIFVPVILFLLPLGLSAQASQNTPAKKSDAPIWIQYSEKLEIVDGTNQSKITMYDTLLLVQNGTICTLRIPVPTNEIKPSKEDPNTMIVDLDKVISVSYDYLVWKKNAPNARLFTYKNSFKTATSVKADSAIKNHLHSFPALIQPDNDSLVSSQETATALTETYKTRFKPDPSYGDSTFLYYEKTDQQVSFSLCPAQDQKKGWKLVKIRGVSNSQKDEQNRTLPEREFIFEIRRVAAERDPVIEKIIAEN